MKRPEEHVLTDYVFTTLRELEDRQGETQYPVSLDAIAAELNLLVSRMELAYILGVLTSQERVHVYDYTENYMTFRSLPERGIEAGCVPGGGESCRPAHITVK